MDFYSLPLVILVFFFRLFSRLTRSNRKVQQSEADDIFPVHFLDQAGIIRGCIVSFTFRYNDVLDPEVLHDALVKLLEIEDWKKLAGRLRLNVRYFT